MVGEAGQRRIRHGEEQWGVTSMTNSGDTNARMIGLPCGFSGTTELRVHVRSGNNLDFGEARSCQQ